LEREGRRTKDCHIADFPDAFKSPTGAKLPLRFRDRLCHQPNDRLAATASDRGMSVSTSSCLLARLLASGKFWLKRARIEPRDLGEGTPPPGADGALLADLRIEGDRIRAVLPAGEAPCCAPGLCLDGASVRPCGGCTAVAPGQPADLTVIFPDGARLEIGAGRVVHADPPPSRV